MMAMLLNPSPTHKITILARDRRHKTGDSRPWHLVGHCTEVKLDTKKEVVELRHDPIFDPRPWAPPTQIPVRIWTEVTFVGFTPFADLSVWLLRDAVTLSIEIEGNQQSLLIPKFQTMKCSRPSPLEQIEAFFGIAHHVGRRNVPLMWLARQRPIRYPRRLAKWKRGTVRVGTG